MSVPTCKRCGVALGQQAEKAIGSGEVQMVWASVLTGDWVCPMTGDEHEPGERVGMFVVMEGNPVDGFVVHGIPPWDSHEDATTWADENCDEAWWIVPLQDVE
jgi:hypothetical protein